MKTENIKTQQLLDLQEQCIKQGVDFSSMQKLLNSEKVKKLQKRNHYIQQTIDNEIDKLINYEDK